MWGIGWGGIELGGGTYSKEPLLFPVTLKSAFQTGTLGNFGCPISENTFSRSWLCPKGGCGHEEINGPKVWVFQTSAREGERRSQDAGQGDGGLPGQHTLPWRKHKAWAVDPPARGGYSR